MPHPRLKPHARPLHRGAGTVQLGLASGAVLDGLTEPEVRLLHRLDGSQDRDGLYAVASAEGVAPPRVTALLDALRASDLLVEHPSDRACLTAWSRSRWEELTADAEALATTRPASGDGCALLAARQRQHVLVGGDGSLAAELARLLRHAGVGRVDTGAAALDAAELDLREGDATGETPGLVVLLASGALDPATGAPWLRHGIPHLPVVAQGTRVLVGPLVRAGHGACLHCLDLHRTDRDPAWPRLLAQLSPARPVGWSRPVEAATALTATAAGLVAMVAHHHLDGAPAPEGLSFEVSLPWPQLVHRHWPVHPRCPCRAAREAASSGAEAGTDVAG